MATRPCLQRLLHSNLLSVTANQPKGIPQLSTLSQKLLLKEKNITNSNPNIRQHQQVTAMSTQNIISVEDGETIIRSSYPDIKELETPFGEFMISFLDKYKNLQLMVCFSTLNGPCTKRSRVFNPSPNNKILDVTKLKALAGDKLNIAKMMFSFFDRVENTVVKGENAGYQHFLLFPQCFPELSS